MHPVTAGQHRLRDGRREPPCGTMVRPNPVAARSSAEASSVEAGAATYRARRPPMASAGPAAAVSAQACASSAGTGMLMLQFKPAREAAWLGPLLARD